MEESVSDIQTKLNRLKDWFTSVEGSIVAFSGGIDSSLVLFLARLFQGKERVVAVISRSESLKNRDFEIARSFSDQYDIKMEVIVTNELEDDSYNKNPFDRCYFCKDHLYRDMQLIIEKYPGFILLNGTNIDDHSDYRPGIQAAMQYKVRSPLAECSVTKEDIRQIARFYKLPNWDKPASPCLSSRIPYNHEITRKKLVEVEKAENFLNDSGFNDVRVRHYGEYGRIEVKPEDIDRLINMKDSIVEKILSIGFKRVEIDEEGLVSGKMNRVIAKQNSIQ
jgi:pyridinium-3,5-biscarboxylic acid mononucleotide sulfurtransferase